VKHRARPSPPAPDPRRFVFPDLPEGVPIIVALGCLFVADALLDGSALAAVATAIGLALLAGLSYRDRTRWGIEHREARRSLEAAMGSTERSALAATRTLPLVFGLIVGLLRGDGFNVRVAAAATLAGFLIAQIGFATWFRARRSR
jgi:hypothetical protein